MAVRQLAGRRLPAHHCRWRDHKSAWGGPRNENDGSTARGVDPDIAPDLSKDGRPEEFARAPVRRWRPPTARPKVSTAIRLSREVIDHCRAGGRGWQTRMDHALRDWIRQHDVA